MPQVRDAVATKDRILEAAFDEFTKRGFAGARVDHIAVQAGCNKALLYHYYEHKEGLFRSVLECKMAVLHEIDVAPDRVLEVVGDVFDLHAANPWMSRLLAWEALDFGTKRVPNEKERGARLAQHVASIERAQAAGAIDPALDARQTLATLIGLVTFWFAFPQMARLIAGGDPYTPQMLKRRRAHVIDAARRIMEIR